MPNLARGGGTYIFVDILANKNTKINCKGANKTTEVRKGIINKNIIGLSVQIAYSMLPSLVYPHGASP